MNKTENKNQNPSSVILRNLSIAGGAQPHAPPLPTKVPTTAELSALVAEAMDYVRKAELLPGLILVSPGTKLHLAKAAPGSERHIQAMAAASRLYPDAVRGTSDPQALTDSIVFYNDLIALRGVVARLHKAIDDTMTVTLSGAWTESLDIYAILSRKAAADPGIAVQIAAMAAYLARTPAAAPVTAPVEAVVPTAETNGSGTVTAVDPSASTNGSATH